MDTLIFFLTLIVVAYIVQNLLRIVANWLCGTQWTGIYSISSVCVCPDLAGTVRTVMFYVILNRRNGTRNFAKPARSSRPRPPFCA